MVFGTLALFIKATVDIGGIGAIFDSAKRGGRFNFFRYRPIYMCLFHIVNLLL